MLPQRGAKMVNSGKPLRMHKIHVMKKQFYHFSTPIAYSQKKEGKAWLSAVSHVILEL